MKMKNFRDAGISAQIFENSETPAEIMGFLKAQHWLIKWIILVFQKFKKLLKQQKKTIFNFFLNFGLFVEDFLKIHLEIELEKKWNGILMIIKFRIVITKNKVLVTEKFIFSKFQKFLTLIFFFFFKFKFWF